MVQTSAGPVPRRPPPRRVEVVRVQNPTPRLARVTFGGEEFVDVVVDTPAQHVKVFFPSEEMPIADVPIDHPERTDGVLPPSRTYTPRRFDASRLELEVDFVLHGTGLASSWAQSVTPGTIAGVRGPRSAGYRPVHGSTSFVLAGDESALPAISTILRTLSAESTARVVIETSAASEIQELESDAKIEATWLVRDEAREPGDALRRAIQTVDVDAHNQVWVATEAKVVRQIRRFLLEDLGHPREDIVTRGYWKIGEQNHPDHDYGED